MKTIAKFLAKFIATLLTRCLTAALRPLALAAASFITVTVTRMLGSLYGTGVGFASDSSESGWQRAGMAALLVVTAPSGLPYYAACRVWDAVRARFGTGLEDLSPF